MLALRNGHREARVHREVATERVDGDSGKRSGTGEHDPAGNTACTRSCHRHLSGEGSGKPLPKRARSARATGMDCKRRIANGNAGAERETQSVEPELSRRCGIGRACRSGIGNLVQTAADAASTAVEL